MAPSKMRRTAGPVAVFSKPCCCTFEAPTVTTQSKHFVAIIEQLSFVGVSWIPRVGDRGLKRQLCGCDGSIDQLMRR